MSIAELVYHIMYKMSITECQNDTSIDTLYPPADRRAEDFFVCGKKDCDFMFKNKSESGKNNICGENVAAYRKAMHPKMSQRALAAKMQLIGIDLDKNAVQRIECGKRFVTDIELEALSRVLGVSCADLLRRDSV